LVPTFGQRDAGNLSPVVLIFNLNQSLCRAATPPHGSPHNVNCDFAADA
jgi:hypothetical protein